jgi:hypothetical protein
MSYNLYMFHASNHSKLYSEKKDRVMINNNYVKVGKIVLFGWVDKALD